MKSNGYGSFIQNIVFKVPLSQASMVTDALNVEPFTVDEANGTASFTIHMTTTRIGGDETVVWKLMNMLPDEIRYRIDWQKSDY